MFYFIILLTIINTFYDSDRFRISSATFVELERFKAAESDPISVEITDKQCLVLRIFSESITYKYQIVIKSQETNDKLIIDDLIADSLGSITITINDTKKINGVLEVVMLDGAMNTEQAYL